MNPELSIIIPALNEEQTLPRLLDELAAQVDLRCQIIVTDGGSTDATLQIARAAGVEVATGPPGRGAQLNRGHALARAQLLLFLHADSELRDPLLLRRALHAFALARESSSQRLAGHFQLRFVGPGAGANTLRYYEAKTALSRVETINGDQGLLIETDWFDDLGGYDESLPYLEDQKIGTLIHARGAWLRLPGMLHTSARRFDEEGHTARILQNAWVMAFHHVGYEPFFTDPVSTYSAPGTTGRVAIEAFLGRVSGLIASEPAADRARLWYQLGRYMNRRALWQIFFSLDVHQRGHLAADEHPWLDLYDRTLTPLTHHAAGDMVGGVSGWLGLRAARLGLTMLERSAIRGRWRS